MMAPGAQRQSVEDALLAWRAPPAGSAAAVPAVLAEGLREVLQIAGGKLPSAADAYSRAAALRRAACDVVKTHLLGSTGSYYTLLGVPRSAGPELVKERYRQLMRLLHPDFADTEGAQWPADAAARVNQAYEVLGSAEKRKHYDQSLGTPAAKSAAVERRRATPPVPLPKRSRVPSRSALPRLAAAFGVAGALGAAAFLVAGAGERSMLVSTAPSEPPQAASEPASAPVTATPAVQAPEIVAMNPPPLASPPVAAARPPHDEPPEAAAIAAPAPDIAPPPPTPPAIVAPVAVAIPAVDAAPRPAEPARSPLPPRETVALPVPPRESPRVAPNPGVTLAQVHPLLTELLQQIESGRPDRVLGQLDRDGRRAPAAQALARQYTSLVGPDRNVHVADAQFSSQPREGFLLVKGRVLLQVGTPGAGVENKEFALLAEFASREGSVVLTRLAPAQPEVAQ